MPAFQGDGAWCLPGGDGLLEGNPDDAGRRTHYHVSRTGAVSLVAGVPANAKVMGVGVGRVYFAVEEDDGIMSVVRYRITAP